MYELFMIIFHTTDYWIKNTDDTDVFGSELAQAGPSSELDDIGLDADIELPPPSPTSTHSSFHSDVFYLGSAPEPPDAAPDYAPHIFELPPIPTERFRESEACDAVSVHTFSTTNNHPPLSSHSADYPWDDDIPDEFDDMHIPPEEDELCAVSPSRSFNLGDSDYPRPSPPRFFLEHMAEQSKRTGIIHEAPTTASAAGALCDIEILLRGTSRGQNSKGYKEPDFDGPFIRLRVEGIRAMLSLYSDSRSKIYGLWGSSALQAALAFGRGNYCARTLAKLSRQYILDRTVLPINPYSAWSTSMLSDEDLAEDIRLYLQSEGKFITAEKLQAYLDHPDVREKHGLEKGISIRTAHRYLTSLGFRFTAAKKGQYTDGHE